MAEGLFGLWNSGEKWQLKKHASFEYLLIGKELRMVIIEGRYGWNWIRLIRGASL